MELGYIYDNGYKLLGLKQDLISYLRDSLITSDMEEEIYDIIKELQELEDDAVVVINYDNGMGYTIDYWEEKHIVKESE
jgi:hypothetical protein